MDELEDDNWLNKKHINCPSCNEILLICDYYPQYSCVQQKIE